MANSVLLRGYKYSVYNWIARVALHEKGVSYETIEVDPFAESTSENDLGHHPFGRVPVLSHGAFEIFETAAIVRYIDSAFDGPILTPAEARAHARATQVVSIIDSYGYQPLVRKVFTNPVFRPALGETGDEAEVIEGLAGSVQVLAALNTIASEGLVLDGQSFTIADCHLAPMLAYFVQAPEGSDALRHYPTLANWWSHVSRRYSLTETYPGRPES